MHTVKSHLEVFDNYLAAIGKNWLKHKNMNFVINLQNNPCLVMHLNKLPDFPPSNEMLEALIFQFNDISLARNPCFAEYLTNRKLEFYNVCSVMRILLSIEDLSTMQSYATLMQSEVAVQKSKRMFKIRLAPTKMNAEDVVSPNLDEVVLVPKSSLVASPLPKQLILALLPHSHELLPEKDPMRRFVGTVENVSRTTIHIKFSRGSRPGDDYIFGQRFLIIIRSRRLRFRYMYKALKLLQEMPLVRKYLYPFPEWLNHLVNQSKLCMHNGEVLPSWLQAKPPPVLAPTTVLRLLNPSIYDNAEQLQAVKRIVAGPSLQGPYIVFGPPGTGKSTTIVEAILQLRLQQPRSRILVTAGSNSACDTIALMLCKYLHSNDRLQEHFARQDKPKPDHQIYRLFSRSVHRKGLKLVPELLLKHSNCSKRIYEHHGVSHILKYGITVATLCTVGRLVCDNLGKHNFFTHIFIDEAGASTEPETLIGIMGIKKTSDCHVILSGDHKQLGAVVKNNRAAALGLGQSLMERLLCSEAYKIDANGNYDSSLQTRLRRNYRSHPEIVRLFNELYYNGELIAQAPASKVNQAANWKLLPNGAFPIIFQATHGVTKREENSASSFNQLEAQVICWYVKRLVNRGLGVGMRVNQKDIGIVAPYTAQGNLITELLRKQGHHLVEVGSVETYQGREKLIILASLVRSFANMGFMRNPRRVNVLLSRANSLLILVGNPVTLRHHPDFKFIISECKQQGTYAFKEKDTHPKPQFLREVKEDDSDASSEVEVDDNIPWFARMPQDISVALGKMELVDKDDSSTGDWSSASDDAS